MVLHEHIIETKDPKPFKLYAIGDIHLGSKQCDEKAFKRDVKRATKDPNALVILMGDMIDSIVATDTKRYRADTIKNPVDDIIDRDIDDLLEILKPLKNKLIGVITGNHEDTITGRSSVIFRYGQGNRLLCIFR